MYETALKHALKVIEQLVGLELENITNQEYPLTFQNGRLLAPIQFSLLVNPVSNSVGYTSNVSINVRGYS